MVCTRLYHADLCYLSLFRRLLGIRPAWPSSLQADGYSVSESESRGELDQYDTFLSGMQVRQNIPKCGIPLPFPARTR
jgi:hypothetical protein